MMVGVSGNAIGAVVVAIVIVALVGGLGLLLTVRQRRRRAAARAEVVAAMQAWAGARGWSFTAEDPELARTESPGGFDLEHPAKANHSWTRAVARGTEASASLVIRIAEWERTRYVQTYNPQGGTLTHTVHDFCASAVATLPGPVPELAVVPVAHSGTGDEQESLGPLGTQYLVLPNGAETERVLTSEIVQWQAGQAPGFGWRTHRGVVEVWSFGHLATTVADELVSRTVALARLLRVGS